MDKIGLLISGNEILDGRIRDYNGWFIASELSKYGFRITRWISCNDDELELKKGLAYLFEDCTTVVITGGLGPTVDDLTAKVVAAYFSLPMEFNQEAWDICVDRFSKMGIANIPDSNIKQALLPSKCIPLQNENGTAAGFIVENSLPSTTNTLRVMALPGVPAEMEPMFKRYMGDFLRKASAAKKLTYTWNFFEIGESKLQDILQAAEKALLNVLPNIHVFYKANGGWISWGLTYFEEDSAQESLANYVKNSLEPELQRLFPGHLLYRGEKSLAEYLLEKLYERKLLLTVAESCTGGLIAAELTKIPECSRVFMGGFVTYSNESKIDVLGVEPISLDRYGAVSIDVAAEMAIGARKVLACDIAMASSGVAGPSGGTATHPVGLVCFCISILKNRVKNEDSLQEKLQKIGFVLQPKKEREFEAEQRRSLEFTAVKKFSPHFDRETIQHRSMIYNLASLIYIIDELK